MRNKCSHSRKSPLKPMLSATFSCRLLAGIQPAILVEGDPPHRIIPDALPFFAFPASLLISTGIALAWDKDV